MPRFSGVPVEPSAGGGRFGGIPVEQPRADFSGVTARVIPKAAPPARTIPQEVGRSFGLGARSVIRGLYGLTGIVSDPITQGINALSDAITPKQNLSGLITGKQPERPIPRQATAREAADYLSDRLGLPSPETPVERISGDVTSALTGTGLTLGVGGLLNAGRSAAASPTIRSRIGDLLTTQQTLQTTSAATGAGASGATREAGGSEGAQLAAGLVGGLGPGVAQAAGAATTRGLVRGRSGESMRQAIQDFKAVGATPSVGQASGNSAIQGAESLLAGAPTSTAVMDRFATNQAQSIGAGLQQRAEGLFRNASGERAGRAVERGIEQFGRNTGATKRALYWQADRFIPETTPVPLSNTWQTVAKLTAPTPGAAATTGALVNPRIAQLRQTLEQDLAGGGGQIPYAALKRIRTEIGEQLTDYSLSPDTPTRELKQLYASLSRDMEAAAQAQGPEAFSAAQRANSYTRAVADRLDTVQRVVDKNGGPEKVFEAAMSGTRDGGTTLRAVMQSLPKEGQRAITGAVIKRMGLANPGQQGAEGAEFSAQTFLTNWNKVSPEAKRALFDRHGPSFSRDMDRIARVAENIRTGSRVYANPSGTANKAAAYTYGAGLVASLFDPSFVSTGTLVGSGIGANVLARKLTDPDVVRWLANTTALPVGSALGAIQALRRIGENKDDDEIVQLADELASQHRENEGA